MINVVVLNSLIKMLFINLTINYIFFKNILNQKLKHRRFVLAVLNSILISSIFTFMHRIIEIDTLSTFIFSYIAYSIIMMIIEKINLLQSLFITAISTTISILFMIIAMMIYFSILTLLPIKFNNFIYNEYEYIIVGLIQIIIAYLFFKIKKFKYGFTFVKKFTKTKNTEYVGIIICICSLLLCVLFGLTKDTKIMNYIIFSLIIVGIILYNWIHTRLNKYYESEITDDTIKLLQEENESLKSRLEAISKINHNYSKRISALEEAVNSSSLEAGGEISGDLISAVKKLSEDFRKDGMDSESKIELTSTNVFAIDNILTHMKKEANKYNIEFNVQINDSVKYIIDNIIDEGKFITMLSNHINNSIIAINSTETTTRAILLVLGLIGGSQCRQLKAVIIENT